MLISSRRPPNVSWSISQSLDDPISFATPATALTDGRPGSVTRFVWPAGDPLDVVVAIEGVWPTAQARKIGLIGIFGTNIPSSMVITCQLRLATSGAFVGAQSFRVATELPRGGRVGLHLVNAVGNSIDGMRLRIQFPVGGTGTPIAAGSVVEIGELWFGELHEVAHKGKWNVSTEDPSTNTSTSEWMQPTTVRGVPRRVLTWTPAMVDQDGIYNRDPGVGAAVPLDFESLQARIDRGQQAVYIPRHKLPSGVASNHLMSRSAILGVCSKIAGFGHTAGKWYVPDVFTVVESPIPVNAPL